MMFQIHAETNSDALTFCLNFAKTSLPVVVAGAAGPFTPETNAKPIQSAQSLRGRLSFSGLGKRSFVSFTVEFCSFTCSPTLGCTPCCPLAPPSCWCPTPSSSPRASARSTSGSPNRPRSADPRGTAWLGVRRSTRAQRNVHAFFRICLAAHTNFNRNPTCRQAAGLEFFSFGFLRASALTVSLETSSITRCFPERLLCCHSRSLATCQWECAAPHSYSRNARGGAGERNPECAVQSS